MRLLLDAHVDPDVATGLRRVLAIEVLALRDWHSGSYREADDALLLRAAYAEGWTLVTFDRKTISPMATEWAERGEPHAGLIFVDDHTFAQNDVGGIVRALVRLLDTLGDVSWENRQVYLRR
jgi:hypothetical protein